MKRLWFKQAKGLNVKFDPVRLEYDPESGMQWLAVAYNVDVDLTGRVGRRKGFAETGVTGEVHSLCSNGAICLFVKDGVMYRLGTDYSSVTVVNLDSDARVSYTTVGPRVYWTNGKSKGVVYAGGVAEDWVVPSTVYGPETTRKYAAPMAGRIVQYYRGRIYMAHENVLWYSEAYGPNLLDYTRNSLPFEGEIVMVHPVQKGIYVGTEGVVWFLRGSNPLEFDWEVVHKSPVVRGSSCDIPLHKVSSELQGSGVIWTGVDGICLGLPDGHVMPLTDKNLLYESGTVAAAVEIGSRYISTMPDTEEGILTLVLNPYNLAATQYLNYNFNSYAVFGGKVLGAGEEGLMELESGDSDAGESISSLLVLPPTDFGYAGTKSIRFIEISYETNGGLLITPIADEVAGDPVEVVPSNRGNLQATQKIPVGRYLRGRYFGLQIENLQSADFSIDLISVELAGLLPASR